MNTFIIGKEGNQPFKIAKDSMVSRKHAKVTIDDDGTWTIEDLNSSNGTFIRNDKGILVRVNRMQITPDTFICLGPDNALGCTFYACRLTAETDDYSREFKQLLALSNELTVKTEHVSRTSQLVTMFIGVVSLLVLVLSFLPLIPDQGARLNLLRVGTALSTCSSLLYHPNKRLKKITAHYTQQFKCPNPNCSHTLTQKEITDCQCMRCKAHA